MVEEQIEFKILIAHLHAHLFADKGEAVAEPLHGDDAVAEARVLEDAADIAVLGLLVVAAQQIRNLPNKGRKTHGLTVRDKTMDFHCLPC